MAIGVWEPGSPSNLTLEQIKVVLFAVKDMNMNELSSTLEESFVQSHSHMMKLDKSSWENAAELDSKEIETLIRFFTLAEMQLPDWNGGDKNPVIYMARILKSRGEFSVELKKWVKANSDNRYLPNGSVL
jgi:hypothetical protein